MQGTEKTETLGVGTLEVARSDIVCVRVFFGGGCHGTWMCYGIRPNTAITLCCPPLLAVAYPKVQDELLGSLRLQLLDRLLHRGGGAAVELRQCDVPAFQWGRCLSLKADQNKIPPN